MSCSRLGDEVAKEASFGSVTRAIWSLICVHLRHLRMTLHHEIEVGFRAKDAEDAKEKL